jgi:glycosyltransferase involved in cell wall biosynthesis
LLLDLMASVRSAAPEWTLYLIVPRDGLLRAEAASLGVTTIVLPFPPAIARLGDASGRQRIVRLVVALPAMVRYAVQLRRMLRKIAPQVVHTNGLKMHALGAVAAPRAIPVVWHVHDYVSTRPVMRRAMRFLGRRGVAALANSRSVAEDVRRVCDASVRVQTMYNAVDLARFAPDGAVHEFDAAGDIASARPGDVKIGLVATYARWKGHEVFLRAIAALPRELPIRAYVVGGAIYQTDDSQLTLGELRALASALSLDGRVEFTGHVTDAAAVYRGLDVVVHASTKPEPFGLVIAEAMACGRAVIVSAAGGASELVRPGVDALTFSSGDVTALADCIRSLVASAPDRARIGAEARRSAERRFDRRRLATEVLPLYRELIDTA